MSRSRVELEGSTGFHYLATSCIQKNTQSCSGGLLLCEPRPFHLSALDASVFAGEVAQKSIY